MKKQDIAKLDLLALGQRLQSADGDRKDIERAAKSAPRHAVGKLRDAHRRVCEEIRRLASAIEAARRASGIWAEAEGIVIGARRELSRCKSPTRRLELIDTIAAISPGHGKALAKAEANRDDDESGWLPPATPPTPPRNRYRTLTRAEKRADREARGAAIAAKRVAPPPTPPRSSVEDALARWGNPEREERPLRPLVDVESTLPHEGWVLLKALAKK